MDPIWIETEMGSAVSELFCLVAMVLVAQVSSVPKVTLGDIEARLFYKGTGRLSDNVLSRKREFTFFNTIIGEGDAEEAADDLLISVQMSSGKWGSPDENEQLVPSPVVIKVVDQNGKVLGQRTFDSVLTSTTGSEYKALWLTDVTCAGNVTVTATFAGQAKSAKLSLGCGE